MADSCDVFAGVVCTLRMKGGGFGVVDLFVDYHLSIGFSHIWLYFDDIHDDSWKEVKDYSEERLTIIRRSQSEREKVWTNDSPDLIKRLGGIGVTRDHVTARQILNASEALKTALKAPENSSRHVEYLVHIDIDELFYTKSNSIIPHFRWLKSQGIHHITYANHEGIPHRTDIDNYFTQITLFRRNLLTLSLSPSTKKSVSFFTSRTPHHQYFLFYDNGKSAVRVQPGVFPKNVHGWSLPRPEMGQGMQSEGKSKRMVSALVDARNLNLKGYVDVRDPCILHYPVCGERWLRSKYEILGPFPTHWPSLERKVNIPPCFHLDARKAATSPKPTEKLKDLFLSQVILSDNLEISKQIASGTCMRITDIASRRTRKVKGSKNSTPVSEKSREREDISGKSVEESSEKFLVLKPESKESGESAEFSEKCLDLKDETQKSVKSGRGDGLNALAMDKTWLISQIAREFLVTGTTKVRS